jgi:hypothetical protein
MRRMRDLHWVLILLLAATAAHAEPSAEALALVAQLEKAPDAQRDTPEHHARLARAYQKAGQSEKCADAALIARLAGDAGADLAAVLPALADEAKARYDEAMKALAAKDMKAAAQAYLQSLKRDPAVLGRDDGGIRAVAFDALKKSAQKNPDVPHRWKLALYAYLFGELQTASDTLRALSASPPADHRWKIGVLSAKVESEFAHAKAEDAKSHRPAVNLKGVGGAGGGAGGDLPDTSSTGGGEDAGGDPNAEKRMQLQTEIEKTDKLITYYSNPEGYKYNIDDTGDSRVVKFSSSGPRLQEKIEGLKARKAQLELELYNLK